MKTIHVTILTIFMLVLPVFFSPASALCHAEANTPAAEEALPELQALDGKRFGVQTGSTFDRDVASWFPHAQIAYYNSLPDLVAALQTGKIDAFPSDEIALEMMKGEGAELKVLEPYMDHYSCGFVFAKTPHGGHPRDEMDAWLTEARESGLLDEMLDKWLHADEAAKTMPDPNSLPDENGTLVFATEAGFPPFDYIRFGEVVGFEVEMAIDFCADRGYGIVLIPMNFDGILPAIQSGKVDFSASGFAITPERMESVNFSQPYYSGGTKIVVPNTESSGVSWWSTVLSSFEKTFLREDRWKLFAVGIENTLLITALSILGGTALGFGIFMLCRNGNPAANMITRFAMHLVQGMPMVVLLMILYYVIFGSISISGIAVAAIGLMLTFGAGVFGLLKIGVGAVDRGQYEAAYALGHSDRHTFFRIVLPQALPHILPAYKGEIVGLLKATAIVGYIAVQDLTKMGDIVRSRTYEAFFPLIAVALIYFLLEDLFNFLVGRLERKMNPRRRTREDILKGVKADDTD